MKKVLFPVCVAAAVAMLSISTQAEEKKPPKKEGKKPDLEMVFKKLDKDADEKLTLAEFTGKRDAEKAKAMFERLDKDLDKVLTLAEFKDRGKKKPKPKSE